MAISKKENSPQELQSFRKQPFLLLTLILVVVFFAFSPALKNNFISWDDAQHITENKLVRSLSLSNIKKIFVTPTMAVYAPLTIFSYALEYHFFGLNSFVFHLNNLILHLAVTALIFVFVLRFGFNLYVAGFTAIVFGLHPIHVESVAWATERKDVLYSFFYMLSLLSYLNYVKDQRKKYFVLAILWGILSILSKPMALSLPLIFCLIDWRYKRGVTKKVIIEKLIHLVYIVPILWKTYVLHARVPGTSFEESMLTYLWTLTFYVQKFLFPFVLIPLYQLPQPIDFLNSHYLMAIVTLLVFLFFLIRYRNNFWFVWACLYYFLSIFFILRFDHAVDISIVADRFMYLPSLGFCLLLGILSEKMWNDVQSKNVLWRGVCIFFGAALVIGLGTKTYFQTKIWKNNSIFWSYIISKDRHNAIAYNNQGLLYRDQKKYDLALIDMTYALELNPKYVEVYNNRGVIYKEQGKYDLALRDWTSALVLNPKYSEAYNNRGVLYRDTNQFDLALDDYNQAILFNPADKQAYTNRGNLYAAMKQYDLALKDYERALKINPYFYIVYNNRAFVYVMKNDLQRALADYNMLLKMKPDFVKGYINRGRLYQKMDKPDLAKKDFERASKH